VEPLGRVAVLHDATGAPRVGRAVAVSAWAPLKWIVRRVPVACAAAPGPAILGFVGVHGMLELGRWLNGRSKVEQVMVRERWSGRVLRFWGGCAQEE
jgi:hypothetical protein